MRRFLLLLLMGVTVTLHAQYEATNLSGPKPFYVPWKLQKRELYKNNGIFDMKDGAGLSLSEFFSLEGNRYYFDYYQQLRYSPAEQPGFTREGSQALNVLGVGRLPLFKTLNFFGKIGPAYYEPSSEFENPLLLTDPNEEWGISYSTGASVKLNPRLQLSLEYMRTENDILDIDTSIAQMTWNF